MQVTIEGRPMELCGLTAAMVEYLVQHRPDLDAMPVGSLVVSWNADKGTVAFEKREHSRALYAARPRVT